MCSQQLIQGPVSAAQSGVDILEVVDAADNAKTQYVISPGDRFLGVFSSKQDVDWIGIDLASGDKYEILLDGLNVGYTVSGQTVIEIRNESGYLLRSRSVSGAYSEIDMEYLATFSGRHYLSVKAPKAMSYELSVAEFTRIEPQVATLGELAGYLVSGHWKDNGSRKRHFDVSEDNLITVNIEGLDFDGKRLARWAMEAWESVVDVHFVEKLGPADIKVDDEQSGGETITWVAGEFITRAKINIGKDVSGGTQEKIGEFGFQAYLHEFGHALGLGHPGNYNGAAQFGFDEKFLNDSWQVSVMSYFSQDKNTWTNASRAEVITPMAADVIAVQRLYGAPDASSITNGDTIYGLGHSLGNSWLGRVFDSLNKGHATASYDGKLPALTIFDAGGKDIINLSNDEHSQKVSLGSKGVSDVFGGIGNLVIAKGTIIEVFSAGQGDDLVIGNKKANVLRGNGGDDRLNGANGNDRLNGGPGNDVLIGASGNDVLSGRRGMDTFIFGGDFGHDQIIGFSADDREKIDLRKVSEITDFQDLIVNHLFESNGAATIVSDQNSIRLAGVRIDEIGFGMALSENDFLF